MLSFDPGTLTWSPAAFFSASAEGMGVGSQLADFETDSNEPLVSLDVEIVNGNQVVVRWATASEIDNAGFNVRRVSSLHGPVHTTQWNLTDMSISDWTRF